MPLCLHSHLGLCKTSSWMLVVGLQVRPNSQNSENRTTSYNINRTAYLGELNLRPTYQYLEPTQKREATPCCQTERSDIPRRPPFVSFVSFLHRFQHRQGSGRRRRRRLDTIGRHTAPPDGAAACASLRGPLWSSS